MARRVSSPAFVGRGEQLQALRAALERAEAGEAGAVLVSGEAGVGKSRLVRELERVAIEGEARFLAGACIDVGGSELPYAPLVGALRTLVRESDPDSLAELVGAGGDELARLLPELPAAPALAASTDQLAQSRLFEALLGLLARLGKQAPAVLLVEDIHWADPSTRAFLDFLVRNVRRERLLLIATYRTDELHSRHPLRQLLAEVERVPSVERLELPRFTRSELAAQLSAILDEPAEPRLVDELYARSQGNAFFAEELLAAAGESGPGGVPDSLRDALTLRVHSLSEETRRMLRTAAASGSVVGHRLLAATAGLPDEELARTVREAIEHNVLVLDAGHETYSFRHNLLREALYDDMLPGEGIALHAALAGALENDSSLAVGAHGAAAERASHWYAAHALPAALGASLEAAKEAERVWAFAEANLQLERAIDLWERVPPAERPAGATLVELVRRAAEAAHLAGENRRSVGLARRALGLLDPEQDPLGAGLAHERLARYLMAAGETLAALEEYRAASALVPAESTAARAGILAGEGHVLMLEGRCEQSRGFCLEALELARAADARVVECNILNTLGADESFLGNRDAGVELLGLGKRLAEELGAFDELVRSYVNLGQTLDEADRLEDAAALALEGWERLRHRVGGVALFLASEAATRLIRLGRWDEAEALLDEAGEAPPSGLDGALLLGARGALEALRGDFDAAAIDLERARRSGGDDSAIWTVGAFEALAALALGRGRPVEARSIVASYVSSHRAGYAVFVLPLYTVGLRAEAELASAARERGDTAGEREAVERAAELLEQAHGLTRGAWPLGAPPVEATIQIELCELEAARARGDDDADAWAARAARCLEHRRPYLAAYARLREAEAALASGLPRPRIAGALAEARETGARLGARPFLEDVDRVARRARVAIAAESDGTELAGTTAGLTDRELDVLRLVAQGQTNPEIGRTLYMSPKTASVHVSRILTKLGAKSRAEAVDAAHRLGLIGAAAE